MAAAALDAGILVDDGLVDVVEVEVLPVPDGGNGLAAEIIDGGVAALVHEVGQPIAHVLHDLETVDHGRRTHLHGAAAQRDVLGRVAPGGDAADAADGQACGLRVARDLGHHVQRNRFHGRAAIAAVRTPAVGAGAHDHAVQVHPHDGVDGVDQRHRIGPARPGRARRQAHVGDVGRELDDDGQAAVVLAPGRDHLDVLGHLAHGGAHAALAHAVGAAEVELDAVGPGVLHQGQDILPALLLAGHHERDDHGAVGPVALDALDLFEVGVQGPVGDELDVVQPDHMPVLRHQRGIARAVDVDHRGVFAQGLPDHAAPAGLEGAVDVDLLVGGRRRGQPEGIGAADAQEITADVGHGVLP